MKLSLRDFLFFSSLCSCCWLDGYAHSSLRRSFPMDDDDYLLGYRTLCWPRALKQVGVNINQSTSPRSLWPTLGDFVNLEIKQFTAFPAKGAASKLWLIQHLAIFSPPASNADCGPIVLQRLQIASNWRALRRTFSYFQNHCSAPLPSSTAESEEKVQNFPFARFARAQTSSVQIFDQTLTPKNLTQWPGKWPGTKRRPLCLPQAVVVVGRSSPEELAVNLSDGPRSNATIVPVFFVFLFL